MITNVISQHHISLRSNCRSLLHSVRPSIWWGEGLLPSPQISPFTQLFEYHN